MMQWLSRVVKVLLLQVSRMCVAWIGVAWVVIDAVLFLALYLTDSIDLLIVAIAMICSQLAAVGGWLALGDGKCLHRLNVVTVAVLSLPAALNTTVEHFGAWSDSLILSAIIVASVYLPLAAIRAAGLALRPSIPTPAVPYGQFTIGDLLVLTTLAASTVAYLRLVTWNQPAFELYAIVAGTVAGLGLVTWFVAFGLSESWAVIVLATIMSIVFCLLTLYQYLMIPVISALILVISLLATLLSIRFLGYRLCRANQPINGKGEI